MASWLTKNRTQFAIVPIEPSAASRDMWSPATIPPEGQLHKWTMDVVVVTNHGNAYRLAYMHGDCGGVWQRPEQFDIGEEVEWWTETPANKASLKSDERYILTQNN